MIGLLTTGCSRILRPLATAGCRCTTPAGNGGVSLHHARWQRRDVAAPSPVVDAPVAPGSSESTPGSSESTVLGVPRHARQRAWAWAIRRNPAEAAEND